MFQGEIRDVSSVLSELTVARLFAAAASHRSASPDAAAVVVELRVLGGAAEWDRRACDAFFLCLDRALSRVHPPLDPLQCAAAAPELTTAGGGARLARLRVVPTARHFPASHVNRAAPAHGVEGDGAEEKSEDKSGDKSGDKSEDKSGDKSEDAAMEALWDTVRRARGEFGDDGDGDAVRAARRWRLAAWLTARFFNEASWCSGKNVPCAVDAAARDAGRRVLHVDVAGMEIAGLIVGVTQRYAYVAVPQRAAQEAHGNICDINADSASQWALVSRVPIPSALATADARGHCADAAPRKRSRAGAHMCAFQNAAEVMLHDVGPLRCLLPSAQLRVLLRARKAYCARDSAGAVHVTLDDAALVRVSGVSGLNSRADLLDIVRASGARFLRGYERHRSALTAGAGAARLFAALTDTVCARFKKPRGPSRPPPPAAQCARDISALREGPRVEFKAAVGEWAAGAATATTDAERARHTIAAMASTLGGELFVGVTDDGAVIGHARNAAPALRLGGFCPAMGKGAVVAAELRVIGNGGEKGAAPALPREWWKGTRGEEERVVTMVSVTKGQAPFYTTSRRSVPYTRGFASTVPMPMLVCAQRVAQLLP